MKTIKIITTTLIMLLALQINAQIKPKEIIKKKDIKSKLEVNRLPKEVECSYRFRSHRQDRIYHFEYNRNKQITKIRHNYLSTYSSRGSHIYSFYYGSDNKLKKIYIENFFDGRRHNKSIRFFYNDRGVLDKILGSRVNMGNLNLNTTQDKATFNNTVFRLKQNNFIYFDWIDKKTQEKEYISLDVDFNKKGVFSSVNLDVATIIYRNFNFTNMNLLFLHQYQVNKYIRTAKFWNDEDEIETNEIKYNLRYFRDSHDRVIQVIAEEQEDTGRDHSIVYKISY